ncbi:signal peptide protein [Rhodopirellula maiorica SM1]|uniref:Signal peptide protein n=1 Tax=Rhodopirellula maiorica SM1 TaxID=1265738 RepID=M5RQ01_9BACT|nr:hypothetical protein [Rhodopirellula maiorica]EMI21365.1 signal peptide protein [Rhodopirellula maiorica SM1]
MKRILLGLSLLGGSLFASLIAGCDSADDVVVASSTENTSTASVRTVAFREMKPRDYLQAIFSRYHAAGSYRDEGLVRLTMPPTASSSSETKVAPLSVWTNHDTVYLQAYDTRLWSDSEGLTAWIVDPSTRNFDSQVLRAPPIGRRPELKQLLIDPILVEQVAAGLAGPPPQLEWLFAEEPMKQLFLDEHTFAFGQQKTIEQTQCQEIQVAAGEQQYGFWVDIHSGLIRQVDLPSIPASPNANPESPPIRLTLELRGASFDRPNSTPKADSLPENPKFVGHFVPLPPSPPPAILGTRIDRVDMTTSDRKPFQFSGSRSEAKTAVTAMVCFADDVNALNSAVVLQQWSEQLPASLADQTRVVLLLHDAVALRDEVKQLLRQSITLPLIWDPKNELASTLAIPPGTLLLVDSSARIVWIQPSVTPQSLPALGAIISDIAGGVDVPQRMSEQHERDQAAYRSVLRDEYSDLVAKGLVRTSAK